MTPHATASSVPVCTIGLDVSDRTAIAVILDQAGAIVQERKLMCRPEVMRRFFAEHPGARVALEVGTHAQWIHRIATECGCEVILANPRRLALISKNQRKNDRNDARTLAELARVAPHLLHPVPPRSDEALAVRAMLRARDNLVRSRARFIQSVRALVKPFGTRLPSCSAPAFAKKVAPHVPEVLRPAVEPLLAMIAHLNVRIAAFDREVDKVCEERFPATERLRQVRGVGPVTALSFVVAIGDPARFGSARSVGAFFGLVPAQDDSGSTSHQLRISKAGDPIVRRLLVSCSHYILGRFGKDCDLRRYGLAIQQRGGRNAKKRAVVAVARKLAVVLHRLWVSGKPYEPLRATERSSAVPASV